jgi:hypothetical protein
MKQKRLPFIMASLCLAYMALHDGLKHMSPDETLGAVHLHVIRWSLLCSVLIATLGAIFPSLIHILRWLLLGVIGGMIYIALV